MFQAFGLLFMGIIAVIGLIAALVILARHAHGSGEPVIPYRHVDPPALLGPMRYPVSSSSPGSLAATRTNSDATTPSDAVDAILLAYAEGDLTADAAAKELVNRLEAWALDPERDMDKDLRAAVAHELLARGLA